MKRFLLPGLAGCLALLAPRAQAQAMLGTSPYVERFDNLASGLPAGFTVYTGASSGTLGTAGTFGPAKAAWAATGAGFRPPRTRQGSGRGGAPSSGRIVRGQTGREVRSNPSSAPAESNPACQLAAYWRKHLGEIRRDLAAELKSNPEG